MVAGDVLDAQLKVGGRWLPAAVAVPLAFIRNLVLGWFATLHFFEHDYVAPAYVLVTRRATSLSVGRIPAGRRYAEQLDVLKVVRRTMQDLEEDAFLRHWQLGRRT